MEQETSTGTITLPVSNPYGIVTFGDLLSEIGRQFDEEMRLKNAAFSFLLAKDLYNEFHEYLHCDMSSGDTLEGRIEMAEKLMKAKTTTL